MSALRPGLVAGTGAPEIPFPQNSLSCKAAISDWMPVRGGGQYRNACQIFASACKRSGVIFSGGDQACRQLFFG